MTKPGGSLVDRIEEEVLFFKTWATSPLKVGSVTPTSRALASVMVELARPDLAENLHRIGASTDSERRVRLKTVTYGSAVRTYAWNCFPALRNDLRRWLDSALRMEIVSHRDRTTVLQRFSTQCLRTGHAEDLFWLITQWGQDTSTRALSLVTAASDVLEQGLSDERYSALFLRRIRLWSMARVLPPHLALGLVRLCAEAIAPTRPEQALVRLRHLTRNNDQTVSAAARTTLIVLATEDDQFLRRVVHRLADDLRQQGGLGPVKIPVPPRMTVWGSMGQCTYDWRCASAACARSS